MVIIVFFALLATAAGLLATAVLLLANRLRLAGRVFVITLAVYSANLAFMAVGTIVTPQRVVKVGDSYCEDSWCWGVTRVAAESRTQDVIYKVDVHIFSDAGRGKQKAPSIPVLVDERGRRFPLIPDPAVIPYDRALDPADVIATTLTFAAAADARRLFLRGDRITPLPLGLRAFTGIWIREFLEEYFPRETLLRVL